ncbi:Cof-type HAD-IIB family hydrolase [uncultured Anaerococcus sp.]|uniref:Cof-type HAD-IIB family hydrolase n=1 Tax=uncultured Anaerococcus sp. TaxID=293428 RepID=UPI00288AF681|nr:Cof-type HAD-IIB family hydrolase [uncultured Anaerococcus sp.]
MRKLIALDVDGTLVNSEGVITERTRKALIAATKAGHEVMIVSGRPTFGLRDQARALGFDKFGGVLSSYNGGQLYDFKEGKILANHPMDYDLAMEILDLSKSLNLEIMVPHGEVIITDRADNFYSNRESGMLNMEVKEIADIRDSLDFAPNKILFAQDPDKLDEPCAKLREKFGDRTEQVKSARFYYEVMPKGLSKGNSILEACKIFGIAREDIIVFGDEMNDVSMFEVAGTGVAMGNAVESIKKLADFVTKTNNEDGIAYYLENFVLSKEDK